MNKVIDNCHTCRGVLRNMEACPLYMWTGYEAPSLDIALLYTVDMTMVAVSMMPYILAIIIMVLALGYRKNALVCQTIMIITQYVVCHILKVIIKQKRPSRMPASKLVSCSRDLSYGMPSQHSSFTVILSTWFILKRLLTHGTRI